MYINNYQIGSDIEVFLQDKQTKEIVSAEGIIKGSKYEPFHFDEENKYFTTSLDNVSAEFGLPPATEANEFYDNIQKCLMYINSSIPSNLETICVGSAELDFKYIMTENAQTAGCLVSFNAWTGMPIYPSILDNNWRCAGYHIHCGYNDPNEETNIKFVKAMDLFLGIPSIIIEPASKRKSLGYGQAGNYRNQPWGAEARILSSYFASSKELIEWTFNNTLKAIEFVNNNGVEEIEGMGNIIQQTINLENKELAKTLIEEYNITMP